MLFFSLHITDPVNQTSLDVIERAQLTVCLDHTHPQTSKLQLADSGDTQDHHKTVLANRVLHGNGSQYNSCNRWFDHAVQVTNKHCIPYSVQCMRVDTTTFKPSSWYTLVSHCINTCHSAMEHRDRTTILVSRLCVCSR